jgi:hypothetical protein
MIGQNRQAEFQRAKADHDFATEAQELRTNTEITREVHTLTSELHRHLLGAATERDDRESDRTSRTRGSIGLDGGHPPDPTSRGLRRGGREVISSRPALR